MQQLDLLTIWQSDLFENIRMQLELLGNLSDMLYLGRDSKSTLQQHPYLTHKRHQPIAVWHMQLPILRVQLHQTTTCLQTAVNAPQHNTEVNAATQPNS